MNKHKTQITMTKTILLVLTLFLMKMATVSAQVNVTFQVDMSNEIVDGDGVHIAGSFNGWDSSANALTDEDEDGIYEVTLSLNSANFEKFKYVNGTSNWETPGTICSVGGGNDRYLYVPFGDVTLPAVAFNGCASSGVSNVTFKVDMSSEAINGVYIVGYVSGWSDPGLIELNAGADDIYSVTKQYREGEYLEYKFVNNSGWETPGSDCQISNNRFIIVPSNDVELDAVDFNGCGGTSITFQVDLAGETVDGNGVHLVGSFNNWSPSNVSMTNTGGTIYSKTFVFPFEESIEYKFINGNDWPGLETPGIPCSSNTNRQLSISSSDQTLDAVNFNGCSFDYITYKSEAWSNTTGPDPTDHVSIEEDYTGNGFTCTNLFVQNNITLVGADDLVINGDLTNNGSIEVPSGSSLVNMGALLGDGSYTIHRNTSFDETTGRYSIVGTPVVSATTSDLGSLVYQYNETTDYGTNDGADRFEELSAGVALTACKGYFSAFTGSIVFTGTPNTGNLSLPISYTSGSNAGFNLLSNPYPSAIDAEKFIAANSETTGTIYVWDDNGSETTRGSNNDYLTINSMGVAGNVTPAGNQGDWDGYIRSGQGFFVQSNPGGGSAAFDDAMKEPNQNNDEGFFRKNENQTARLMLAGSGLISDALVGFTKDATIGEDHGLDARKFESGNEISIYSMIQDNHYAIQTLPLGLDQVSVPVGFKVSQNGSYQITIDNQLFLEYSSISLYDSYEQRTEVLASGKNTFNFTSESGTFNNRFTLELSKSVLSFEKLEEASFPFKANIYNLRGQLLREVYFENKHQQYLLDGLENQILIMKTPTSSSKLFIKK